MARVQSKSISSYLSVIRSVYVDRTLNTKVFDNSSLKRMLNEAQFLSSSSEKSVKLSILRDMLIKIISSLFFLSEANIDTAFCLFFAALLHIGEITFTEKQRQQPAFAKTKATQSDIIFSPCGSYLIFRLKRSKTDKNKKRVSLTITATDDSVCPVAVMRRLFIYDPQPTNHSLFTASGGAAFTISYVRRILKTHLHRENLDSHLYTGHSFRKSGTQHAKNNSMSDSEV